MPELSDHCEECGAPDDGTQSYCEKCGAALIEEKYMPDDVRRPTVYVLTIETKHGAIVTAYATHDAAERALADYVREYWNEDGPGCDGDPYPDEDDAAIHAYFEFAADETWYITDCEVQGEVTS